MSQGWTPKQWEDYFKENPPAKKSSDTTKQFNKNPKNELQDAIEKNQLAGVYNKLNNGTALNGQDSSIVAKYLPKTPGFEHLADTRGTGRRRFDSLAEGYKNSTLTGTDKYELMNSSLYDWNTDPMNFKNDETGATHPKNPDFKVSEKKRKEQEKIIIEEKAKIDTRKINITKKLESIDKLELETQDLYKTNVEQKINILEELDKSVNLPSDMPNLYTVKHTATGAVSFEFQDIKIQSFLESPRLVNFSEEGKIQLLKNVQAKIPQFKKQLTEINRGLLTYNQKMKVLNELRLDHERLINE